MKDTKQPKRPKKLGIRPFYLLISLGEIAIGVVVAVLLNLLLTKVFHLHLPSPFWVLVFSIVLSCVMGAF